MLGLKLPGKGGRERGKMSMSIASLTLMMLMMMKVDGDDADQYQDRQPGLLPASLVSRRKLGR